MLKKTSIGLLIASLPLLGLTALPVAAKDGTYVTSAMGRNGDVHVEVTIKDNKIADIKILDWSETHPIADLPKEKIPATSFNINRST